MAPKTTTTTTSEKHVIVIGDSQSGKSSLIRSICNNSHPHHHHKSSNNKNDTLESTPFTLHTNDHDYTVHFMEDETTVINEKVLLTSDLILLVIEYDLDESLEQLHSTWLPLIQHARKPFFLVQTKIDLNPHCHLLDFSSVNDYFVGGAIFSTLVPESDDLRDALVFRIFEFLFFSPTSSLTFSSSSSSEEEDDEEEQKHEIRPEFKNVVLKALKRAFWLLDKDGDGYLNPKEYLKFAKLAGIKYTHQECFDIESVKQTSGGSTPGLNVNQFISFLRFLVGHDDNTQAVWNILHSSDVTSGYTVEDQSLIESVMPKINEEQDQIALTDAAYKELSRLFKQFDMDRDGLLSLEEIEEAFSIAFDVENPFLALDTDYMNMTSSEDEKLTEGGWLSLWTLVTHHNPYSFVQCLLRWGVKAQLNQFLFVSKKRKYRTTSHGEEDVQASGTNNDYSKLVNAYIFGSTRCGKSSIMQNLLGWQVSEDGPYTRTTRKQTAINVVEDDQGESYYLAITEFDDNGVLDAVESKSVMDLCDIAIMVFDGADPYSFSYLAKLQQQLDPTIPCIYVLSKTDLEVEEQIYDVPPQDFCEELGLLWPPFYHCATQYDPEEHKTFEEVLYFAHHPKDACPIWEAAESSDDEEEGAGVEQGAGGDKDEDDDDDAEKYADAPKSSLLVRTIKLVGVVSVVAIGSALLWKYVTKSSSSGKKDEEEEAQLSNLAKKMIKK